MTARRKTLTEGLEELERTDPDVAKAAKAYRQMVWRMTRGGPYFRRPKRKLTPKSSEPYG